MTSHLANSKMQSLDGLIIVDGPRKIALREWDIMSRSSLSVRTDDVSALFSFVVKTAPPSCNESESLVPASRDAVR